MQQLHCSFFTQVINPATNEVIGTVESCYNLDGGPKASDGGMLATHSKLGSGLLIFMVGVGGGQKITRETNFFSGI